MSDTVELIIKIPEDYLKGEPIQNGSLMCKKILEAVYNGIPLDSIKAEIEKQIERDFAYGKTEILQVPCHYGIANGLQNAIMFLDNIDKEESEEDFPQAKDIEPTVKGFADTMDILDRIIGKAESEDKK